MLWRRLIWFSCMFWCLFLLILLYLLLFYFGEQITCVPMFIPLIKCKCIVQCGWKMMRNAFFLWLQNGVLINHLNLSLFSIYFYRSVLRYSFFFFSHHLKLLIIENIATIVLIVSDWTSLFPCLGFNVSHVAFSDYKSGFGGKFGVQTERQDPSAVGFDYKEKLAKHESQQGTVFTFYFLTSAATSHTVWNSFLSRKINARNVQILSCASLLLWSSSFLHFTLKNIT